MNLAIVLTGILPKSYIKNRIFRLLGFDVHNSAEINPCLILGVNHISAGANSRIGALTCIRGLKELVLEDSARIGQLNWISSARELAIKSPAGTLRVGTHAAITNRHYLDCSGGISIGPYTTVAGVKSTFITHGINWKVSEQSTAAIRIGNYCILSSNVNVTPGTVLPDYSVVGMGVTIDKGLPGTSGLVLSDRGTTVKTDLTGEYFSRTSGFVGPPGASNPGN